MCWLTWFLAAMASALMLMYASWSRRGGEQEAVGEPGGFFLFGVAGDEGVVGEPLDFPDVMVDYLVDGKGPLAGLGTASLTLYFAVTYTIQRLILQVKAQRIANSPRQDVSDPDARTPSW